MSLCIYAAYAAAFFDIGLANQQERPQRPHWRYLVVPCRWARVFLLPPDAFCCPRSAKPPGAFCSPHTLTLLPMSPAAPTAPTQRTHGTCRSCRARAAATPACCACWTATLRVGACCAASVPLRVKCAGAFEHCVCRTAAPQMPGIAAAGMTLPRGAHAHHPLLFCSAGTFT